MAAFNLPDFSWLPVADAILKATLLLGTAALLSALLRHRSAAARHLVWTLALVGAVALPVLSIALPRWHVPILTLANETTAPAVSTAHPPPIQGPARAAVIEDRAAPAGAVMPMTTPLRAAPPTSIAPAQGIAWQTVLVFIWAAGTLAVGARLALGLIAVSWLARRTEPAHDARWFQLATALASEVGVPPTIRFLRSARATMPIACGILRPAIIMPADADTWPHERIRIVLLHELAHVKRRDCLTHMLAQVACALYWFNPLAWFAARHLRTERERACDDLVLALGTRGPDYADQLLEMARVMRAGRFPAVLAGASLAMAHRSQLEGRLMAILDPKVPRSGITRVGALLATVCAAFALLPLASVQPWAYAEENRGTETVLTSITMTPETIAGPRSNSSQPSPTPGPVPANASEEQRKKAEKAHEQDTVQAVVQGTTQGIVQGVVQGLAQGARVAIAQGAAESVAAAPWTVDVDAEPRVHLDEWKAQGRSKADPKTVAALTEALKDSDKDVRETALQALVQLRDPSIYEPLVAALSDASADVRQNAAFGLGQLGDRRAVSALAAALKDSVADVRQQAVFALGQLRDSAAVEAITAAVRDANADVRQQAVFALGQIRDRRAVEPLISALKDSDPDVREQAAFALGQIRDRTAVEALVFALKDTHADVREQAAFALGQLGDPRAIEGLTTALKDASADVRQRAAFALGQIAR